MGSRSSWNKIWWMFVLIPNFTGSDWLNCAHLAVCQCKWSSGKKTASCVSGGLKEIPHLAADIQVLDLHENPIQVLDQDAFARIELLNIQRLNLSSTNLSYLHPDAFRELRILIELDLSQNEITHLSSDTFRGNDRLRLLILNDNFLSKLVAEQFPTLNHLKRLEISRCKIQTVHPFAFVNLRNIEIIHLQQNFIKFLHEDTFNLPVLKTLTLSENPWNCDCRLKHFHEWFLNSNLGNEEVICSSPENKENIAWSIIKSSEMVCPPRVLTNPLIIRTESGGEITFGCFARGDPKPEVSWTFKDIEIENYTDKNSEVLFYKYSVDNFNEYDDDYINKTAQWVNVTVNNVSSELAGRWQCIAKNIAGEAKSHVTVVISKARTATALTPPDYFTFFILLGSMLAMTGAGFIATCICWKTRRRRVPPSISFTDQEKKLLDTSVAVSCDRTSGELGSSYGFEMLDRSLSMESEDTQRCVEPVHITIEGPPCSFPPPPAQFALPVPYGNIFISVQVSGRNEKYPDLLGGGATLPRRSRTCFIKSAYDNMGPRITAAGSSTWSLPGAKIESKNEDKSTQLSIPSSTFSTEFTAL